MTNLASIYSDQERFKEAEELETQVLGIEKRVLGPEHPSTVTGMNNLAHTYWGQDRHDEALNLMRSVHALNIRTLGEDHPYTIQAKEALQLWGNSL